MLMVMEMSTEHLPSKKENVFTFTEILFKIFCDIQPFNNSVTHIIRNMACKTLGEYCCI